MRITILTREQNRSVEVNVDIIKTTAHKEGHSYIHHEILETCARRIDEHITVGLSRLTLETPHEYKVEYIRYPKELFDNPMFIQNAEAAAAWFCWGKALFGVLQVGVYIDSINRVITLRILKHAEVTVHNDEEPSVDTPAKRTKRRNSNHTT